MSTDNFEFVDDNGEYKYLIKYLNKWIVLPNSKFIYIIIYSRNSSICNYFPFFLLAAAMQNRINSQTISDHGNEMALSIIRILLIRLGSSMGRLFQVLNRGVTHYYNLRQQRIGFLRITHRSAICTCAYQSPAEDPDSEEQE